MSDIKLSYPTTKQNTRPKTPTSLPRTPSFMPSVSRPGVTEADVLNSLVRYCGEQKKDFDRVLADNPELKEAHERAEQAKAEARKGK
jgi:hypothetical protein